MKTLNYYYYPAVILLGVFLARAGVEAGKKCNSGQNNKKLSTSKLVCYYSTLEEIDGCYCTHIVLPANSDVKGIERAKERTRGVKIFVTVNEFNQGLINLLKTSKVDGLELDLKKLNSKNDISDFISTIKTKLGSDLDIALSVPSRADLVAKYFDFKALTKHVDLFILQTAFLGASSNVTFHPSRLSGMWDMQNTDSVVDLVSGLGAPLSKLVVATPVQAFQFTLQNPEYTAPGSPALELKSITRNELCKMMRRGSNWTIERDEDQAGPYIFSKNQWIAFEDPKSMDIKAKYSRVRGLAGIALKDLAQDGGDECGTSILEAAYNGLSRQARAPRGAVLHSLEREMADTPTRPLDSVQLSPYKISRIIDTEGKIHVMRQDTRTEFQCSRQGYFVHPRSCNRFYRCVKFDQLSDDYNVFEFDCPAGLAFDERVEVCVWPGSLPHGTPCSGSSEIAPVPRERFVCPSEPGYYADPENCRWFFACLDHGKSPLSAYEFRCPFGLVFDGDRLVCEWSWLVPKCASGLGVGQDSEYYYGGLGGAGNGLGAGYAAKGQQQSSVLILRNYNGLGALGHVKLGGISGKVEQPIATLYSNVGAGNLGLGYQNSGGYIEGDGLSYKTAQALQNAGLLKVNNGVGYQASGGYYDGNQAVGQSTAYSQANGGALLINADGSYASGVNSHAIGQIGASAGLLDNGANVHLVQGNSIVNNGAGATTYQSSGAGQGAVSSQSFTQYHGAGGQGFTLNTGSNGGYEASNQGYAGAVASNEYNSGYLSIANNAQESAAGYASTGGTFLNGGSGFDNKASAFNAQSSAGGAVSSQSFSQFHGQQESKNIEQFGSGIAGSINIIGGGYSAVGALSGVDILNNREETSSPTLVSVTSSAPVAKVASVPTITAVPVPGIKTVAGFETIRGGVIANVPELQYKVKTLEDAGLFSNISNSFANFVVTSPAHDQNEGLINIVGSSTPRPFVSVTTGQPQIYLSTTQKPPFTVQGQTSQEGFVYSTATPKPAVIVQPIFQKYDNNEGYKYEKPLVQFEENTPRGVVVDTYSTVSTLRPFTDVVEQKYQENYAYSTPKTVVNVDQPTVPTVAFQQYDNNEGYNYEKHQFEGKAQAGVVVNSYSTASTLKPFSVVEQTSQGNYAYSTPKAVVSVQPTVPTVAFQPYNNNGGYNYEGKPQGVVVNSYPTVSTISPAVIVQQQPQIFVSTTPASPVISSYSQASINTNQAAGYVYSKPSIAFEEKPSANPTIISKFNIRKPSAAAQSGGYYYEKPSAKFVGLQPSSVQLKQKALVEDYTYHQPAVVTQYYYQQPSVRKQPIVPLYQQPELLSTYTYQPPLQKQPVSTYTYQNVAQQAVGVQKPAYTYQPTGGSSYQYVNLANTHQQEKSQAGYVYSKPSIVFEQRPQLIEQYSTPKPAVVVQEAKPQGGYVYEKPSAVTFEYSTQRPVAVAAVHPAVVTSYFNVGSSKANAVHQQENVGYTYFKPTAINFEEAPVVYSTPKPLVRPAVVTSNFNIATSSQANAAASYEQHSQAGYNNYYPKPSVDFEEATAVTYSTPKPIAVQPAVGVVSNSYFNIAGSKANSAGVVHQQNIGYSYPKPLVHFEETPAVTYSTPKPVVVPVQPAVVTSYFNLGSAKANSESFVEQQQNVGYSYPKPTVSLEQTPTVVYSTPKPIAVQPAVVSNTYLNTASSKANSGSVVYQQNVGYSYPKPSVHFEETPALTYSTPKPVVVPVQPAVVTSYFNLGSAKANSETVVDQQNVVYPEQSPTVVYSTPKPPVTPAVFTSYFNIKSSPSPQVVVTHTTPKPIIALQAVQPAAVTSYVNIASSTPRPSDVYVHEEKVGYTYQQPAIKFEERPVIYSTPKPLVTSYSYVAPTAPKPVVVQNNVVSSYNYIGSTTQQPNIVVEEEQSAHYTPKEVTPRPAVVTSYFHQQPSRGYEYQKPSVQFEEEPRQPIHEVPFVKKTAYVTGQYQQQQDYQQQNYQQQTGKIVVENYQFPDYEKVKQAVFGQKLYQQQDHQVLYHQQPQVALNYIQSTPKPTFISTIRPIVRKKIQPVTPATVTIYDSRYTSAAPESHYISSTVAPAVHVVSSTSRPISKFSFSSVDDQYQYNDIVKSTTAEPVRTYLPVTSAVRVTTSDLPIVKTSRVVEEFVAPEVTSTTLAREYLPVAITKSSNEYLPVRVRTKAPAREYLPIEVTTPSREYLPSRRVKVVSTTLAPEITTLSREYLPVRTRLRIATTGASLYTIKPRKPATIKVVRPVTVIKQNDAHPLLSAKLGAQCTCVSSNLKLRKKQKLVVVEDDDNDDHDDDDDGYVVDDRNQARNYEPQRVVDITPTPEAAYLPISSTQAYVKKRVKVRPVTKEYYNPVTQVSEIFYQKNPGQNDDDSAPSDREIAKAVRTGLKLVKQAAKQGAKEGTAEVLAKQYDRYGHGGVRSRTESLQGTIDCQRAGLFRHPNECNKFYACRWDCTKNRFTLHVFNCPVHLTFDNTLGACNWPSQGPACVENTLITSD